MEITNHDIMHERKALGSRIRQLRIEQGISQRMLATMIGANHSTLGKIEAGSTNFKYDKLEKIADALGTNVKSLFDY